MVKVRTPFLIVIFGSVFFFLGKTILSPSLNKNKVTRFNFPIAIPLPEWKLKDSHPLSAPVAKRSTYLAGRHYRYIQKDLTLDIDMRYIVNTKGDVESFIQDYSAIPSSPIQSLFIRQREGIGFYSLFANQQRAYLSTCINSRGGSTVTAAQFRQNRNIYDNIFNIHFKDRLLPWLSGQGSIRDMRCLWTHLSIPIKNSSSQDAYPTLEKAWFSWYQWWHSRFPQP